MRYGVAFALAAAITCGIFLMMYHLINEDVDRQQMLENLTMVELFQPPPATGRRTGTRTRARRAGAIRGTNTAGAGAGHPIAHPIN